MSNLVPTFEFEDEVQKCDHELSDQRFVYYAI